MAHRPYRYNGHRADTFIATDVNELVELRARQRTFDGAYGRTALSNLGYALTILKLFDTRFYRIGLLYAVLGVFLFIVSFIRSRHQRHDFADQYQHDPANTKHGIVTVGQENKRVFGRPFKTAGWIVIAVTAVVAAIEVTMLVLLCRI